MRSYYSIDNLNESKQVFSQRKQSDFVSTGVIADTVWVISSRKTYKSIGFIFE